MLGDAIRCLAFLLLLFGGSLGLMIGGAALAGVGTALFGPAALAGLPQLAPGDRRPAAMGLFGALDDLGLTLGPALAAAAAVRAARPTGCSRSTRSPSRSAGC